MSNSNSDQNIVKVAIMGGTFNPIHNGHLAVAELVREQFKLDRVLFLPVGDPPHKSLNILPEKEHRYAMVLLAINDNPFFSVSRMELEREGYTYTVDTLRELTKRYSDKYRFYYIIGADTLMEIDTWRNIHEVFGYADFITVYRPGFSRKEIDRQVGLIYSKYGKMIHVAECPAFEISSTDIRRRIKENLSVRYLIPDEVSQYIRKNQLYMKEMGAGNDGAR